MSDGFTGGIQCPDNRCSISFSMAEEVVAHLRWDHNLSELEAERMVRQSLETNIDHTEPDE